MWHRVFFWSKKWVSPPSLRLPKSFHGCAARYLLFLLQYLWGDDGFCNYNKRNIICEGLYWNTGRQLLPKQVVVHFKVGLLGPFLAARLHWCCGNICPRQCHRSKSYPLNSCRCVPTFPCSRHSICPSHWLCPCVWYIENHWWRLWLTSQLER